MLVCVHSNDWLTKVNSIEPMMIINYRFENRQKQRYYRLVLSQDLFGDWVITRVWGNIGKATGRIIHISCTSYDDAILHIDKIKKIRIQRGYTLCESIPLASEKAKLAALNLKI